VYGTVSFMRANRGNGIPAQRAGLSLRCVSAGGRSADREAAICQAVIELLNEQSYDSVSMDAVAARARASKATIYRRWSNKEELVLHALRQFYPDGEAVVRDTGSLREDLFGQLIGQLQDARAFAANMAAITALVYAAPNDAAFANELRSMLQHAHSSVLQTMLVRAHSRGELARPVDVQLVIEVVQAQFCSRSGMETGELDVGYVAHVVDDVLMPVIRHAGAASPAHTMT
jgi:AcrR family transcriptional regulator